MQGPFKLDVGKSIFIKNEPSKDYPLGLYYDSGVGKTLVDKYETDGDSPSIDTVFFIKVHKIKNVIVLVSWHQLHQAESINGYTYQVYGYKYDGETLTVNKEISADPNLNGMAGEFNGNEMHFKYKNAASIKKYITNKYN